MSPCPYYLFKNNFLFIKLATNSEQLYIQGWVTGLQLGSHSGLAAKSQRVSDCCVTIITGIARKIKRHSWWLWDFRQQNLRRPLLILKTGVPNLWAVRGLQMGHRSIHKCMHALHLNEQQAHVHATCVNEAVRVHACLPAAHTKPSFPPHKPAKLETLGNSALKYILKAFLKVLRFLYLRDGILTLESLWH